jgi:FHA domain-containing protein
VTQAKRKPAAKAGGKPVPIRRALRDVSPLLTDARYWALSPRPAPIDLAVEVCRAMEAGRFRRRGKLYAPTVYTVGLSAADLRRFGERRRELVATLKDVLAWWAGRDRLALPGDLRVRLVEDEDLRSGQVTVEAGLRAEESRRLGRR